MSKTSFRISGRTPSSDLRRRTADSFLVGQALHLSCRIRDHIERLDSGAVYAVDDLAVTLRTMLHRSRGNDVLMRLKETARISSIKIQLSREPSNEVDQFSIGSVPTSASLAVNNAATWVDLAKWASRPLIVARTRPDSFNYSRGSFVNTYANKGAEPTSIGPSLSIFKSLIAMTLAASHCPPTFCGQRRCRYGNCRKCCFPISAGLKTEQTQTSLR